MAEINAPVQPEDDAQPGGQQRGIPTDPAELEAWKQEFVEDLVRRPYDEWSSEPVYKGVRGEGA